MVYPCRKAGIFFCMPLRLLLQHRLHRFWQALLCNNPRLFSFTIPTFRQYVRNANYGYSNTLNGGQLPVLL